MNNKVNEIVIKMQQRSQTLIIQQILQKENQHHIVESSTSDISGPLLGLLATRHAQGDDILSSSLHQLVLKIVAVRRGGVHSAGLSQVLTGGVAREDILLGLANPHLLLGQSLRVVALGIVSGDVRGPGLYFLPALSSS